jgi:transposase
MLTVEERFMLKDWFRKGLSISEIARLSGHDRKTVRALLEEPLLPQRKPRRAKSSKLDAFREYLGKRMAEGVYNARKLCQEIQGQGYEGSESLVRAWVQGLRPARPSQKATVRFETAPGQQAQIDWGHFGVIEHYGRLRHLYAFVMTLGWSRAMYLEFTVSADIAWFLRCHVHAFHYFGGVTREMLHDNLKTAVLGRDAEGHVHWHPRYLDFAQYYGFSPHACQPYRAQTKGKVERGIRYVRGNFWVGLHFTDLANLNQQARVWLDKVANCRRHGTTGQIPAERLPLEGLQPLGAKPDYDTSLISYRRSSRDCLLSYEGNYYSVPSEYALQRLQVKETEEGQLIILSTSNEEIARHALCHQHQQRVVEPGHYAHIRPLSRLSQHPLTAQIIVPPSETVTLPAAPTVEVRPLRVYEQALEEPS